MGRHAGPARWAGTLGLPYQREVLRAYDRARPGVESLGVELTEVAPSVQGADEVFRTLRDGTWRPRSATSWSEQGTGCPP